MGLNPKANEGIHILSPYDGIMEGFSLQDKHHKQSSKLLDPCAKKPSTKITHR